MNVLSLTTLSFIRLVNVLKAEALSVIFLHFDEEKKDSIIVVDYEVWPTSLGYYPSICFSIIPESVFSLTIVILLIFIWDCGHYVEYFTCRQTLVQTQQSDQKPSDKQKTAYDALLELASKSLTNGLLSCANSQGRYFLYIPHKRSRLKKFVQTESVDK